MITTKKRGGLANVVAGDSAICLCGAEDESLLLRGYSIEDLAENASFEEVIWLLLRKELPNKRDLEAYQTGMVNSRKIPHTLLNALNQIPKDCSPMEFLRSAVSLAGAFGHQYGPLKGFEPQDRLIGQLAPMLFSWYSKGKNLECDEKSLSGYFLHQLYGKAPTELQRRCLDVSFILYSEHEFNASTFTVRTIASTMSDYYSAICGGIGALLGPLHGGANECAFDLIRSFNTPEDAEKGILDSLSKRELIMGFGHRVYTTRDPRSDIIKKWAKKLSETASDGYLFSIAEKIEQVMWHEKMLFPNLDFYSALAYHWLSIPKELFTPLFVLSRISGWSAHFLEQQENNKLIRPMSHYIGERHRPFIPLGKR